MARRIPATRIPDTLSKCAVISECPYKKDGLCSQPRTNKGNSDSACFNLSNKVLTWYLSKAN